MTLAPELLSLELSQVRLKALAWGPADGRLALCVHGFPDSAHSWRRVAPLLVDAGFRVVAPFTRGYAPSSLAADGTYHLGALMSDLVEVHTLLGTPDDAVLVGHDWGGWTTNALAASGRSPFVVHVSIALPPVAAIDASAPGLPRALKMGAVQARMSWYIAFVQLPGVAEKVLDRVIPRLWRDWSPSWADVDEDISLTLSALPTLMHRQAAVQYYRDMFRFTAPPPRYADLHASRFELPTVPIMTVHGLEDGACQVGYTDKILDRLPAGSRVETVADAGHFVHLDQPETVARLITEYARPVAR